MKTLIRREFAQWWALPILLAPSVHSMGATAKEILPPPGLYRVDSDTTVTFATLQTEVKQHRDGATGAVHEQKSVHGQASTGDYPGTGQVTECVKPYGGNYGPGIATLSQCTKQDQKIVSKNKLIHTAQCSDSLFSMEVTKLDDKHWQYVTRTETPFLSGRADVGGLEATIKMQAQYGATPQARAEAAKHLAALPAMQKQLDQKRAQDLAEMEAALSEEKDPQARAQIEKMIGALGGKSAQFVPGSPDNSVNVVKAQWTRIADNCGTK